MLDENGAGSGMLRSFSRPIASGGVAPFTLLAQQQQPAQSFGRGGQPTPLGAMTAAELARCFNETLDVLSAIIAGNGNGPRPCLPPATAEMVARTSADLSGFVAAQMLPSYWMSDNAQDRVHLLRAALHALSADMTFAFAMQIAHGCEAFGESVSECVCGARDAFKVLSGEEGELLALMMERVCWLVETSSSIAVVETAALSAAMDLSDERSKDAMLGADAVSFE